MPPTLRRGSTPARAFTLVELLVVIGIIAMLIAILLPALNRAREEANKIKCLANQRQIGMAYLMHAAEHRNYVPTAGLIHQPYNATPPGLRDSAKVKYMYYREGATERPLPMPAALAHYMGQKINADTRQDLERSMDSGPVRELFTCPTQNREYMSRGNILRDNSGWASPDVWSSFIFNEEPLGFLDTPTYKRGQGNLNRMKRASEVMMLGDGVPRVGDGWMVIYALKNNTPLEDAWFGNAAGDRSNFTFSYINGRQDTRHRNRMNIVFMDGHAETVQVTPIPSPRNPTRVTFNPRVYMVPPEGF